MLVNSKQCLNHLGENLNIFLTVSFLSIKFYRSVLIGDEMDFPQVSHRVAPLLPLRTLYLLFLEDIIVMVGLYQKCYKC